jgi:hypothetical protein
MRTFTRRLSLRKVRASALVRDSAVAPTGFLIPPARPVHRVLRATAGAGESR